MLTRGPSRFSIVISSSSGTLRLNRASICSSRLARRSDDQDRNPAVLHRRQWPNHPLRPTGVGKNEFAVQFRNDADNRISERRMACRTCVITRTDLALADRVQATLRSQHAPACTLSSKACSRSEAPWPFADLAHGVA